MITTHLLWMSRLGLLKAALLSWFSKQLRLPNYFGGNWDAFDECLRDLSWITRRKIVLVHRDLPLMGHPMDQKMYSELLDGVVRDWKSDASHEFVVVFDPAFKREINAVACRTDSNLRDGL